ncbi:MAG: hypothetical protein PHZ28_06255 [Candidatus Izemoplasmatales bacterium]|nr:hypothetical protein [Candidatus Izemoplasmatales bacterium]
MAIIYEKGVKSVENALSRLEMVSPLDMSADKVRVLCDHLQEQETVTASAFTDHLTQKAKSTLCSYDRLAQLQAQKTNMEAI